MQSFLLNIFHPWFVDSETSNLRISSADCPYILSFELIDSIVATGFQGEMIHKKAP